MPVYDYTALDQKGKNISGIIDAEGATAARQKIRANGHFPVNLREVADGATEKLSRKGFSLSQYFVRVRPAEIATMTRQLATLIGAGFPLVSALETLMVQFPSPTLKKTIAKIKDAVVEGSSFADALATFPAVFSPVYANMVRAGEASGTLEIVLERLADITENQEALKNKVVTAMIYPLVILFVGILILCFLFIYVIPNITSIFTDIQQELPTPTKLLINTSELFKSYWWALALMLVALLAGFYRLRKHPPSRLWMDEFLLNIPLVGAVAAKLDAARFARTLGSLLDNGVSMLPAMGIVKNIVGNGHIAEGVSTASVEVGKGQALGKSLDAHGTFPPIAIQMIMVGEQSGNLEDMLGKVADVYEKDVETTVMRLTALLEPIMVVVMAVMVLFIVLAIFLPILEMSNQLR